MTEKSVWLHRNWFDKKAAGGTWELQLICGVMLSSFTPFNFYNQAKYRWKQAPSRQLPQGPHVASLRGHCKWSKNEVKV